MTARGGRGGLRTRWNGWMLKPQCCSWEAFIRLDSSDTKNKKFCALCYAISILKTERNLCFRSDLYQWCVHLWGQTELQLGQQQTNGKQVWEKTSYHGLERDGGGIYFARKWLDMFIKTSSSFDLQWNWISSIWWWGQLHDDQKIWLAVDDIMGTAGTCSLQRVGYICLW